MTIRVKPSANGWRVTVHNVTKSRHIKKARAVQNARRLASSGQQLVVHRADGTIQSSQQVR